MSNPQKTPIIIVTGASGIGIGFGICHRLLVQLSRSKSSDSEPRVELASFYAAHGVDDIRLGSCDGLTLILACRSSSRGQLARTQLLELLDRDIAKQKRRSDYDGHAETFRKNLQVDVRLLDLASVSSVFKFGEEITANYPYISHLIFNAASTTMVGMDWKLVPEEILNDFMRAFTSPRFYIQTKGVLSADGFGWVWQCNVFGNYCVYRLLENLLSAYHDDSSSPARVIWLSSLDTYIDEISIEPDDWQLINHDLPYQASKRELDLVVGYLERRNRERSATAGEKAGRTITGIRHVLSQPGVVTTNIQSTIIGFWFIQLMRLSFLCVKLFGSLNHPKNTYQASISTVHSALASIPPNTRLDIKDICMVKMHSQASIWGWEGLKAEVVSDYPAFWKESTLFGEKCEALYQSLLRQNSRAHKTA